MPTQFVQSVALGGAITPTAGNDLILLLLTYTAGATVTSVTSSAGANVIADVPFAIIANSDNMGFGVYRVHGASAVAQAINPDFGGTTSYRGWLIEASSVVAFDPNTVAVLTGSGTTIETNALTPSQDGALLLAFGGSNHFVASQGGWGDGFSNLGAFIGGPTSLAGYLDQSTASGAAPTNTVGTSVSPWAALIVSYIPTESGGASDPVETAFEGWIDAQNALPGIVQVPPKHCPIPAERFFSAPWHSITAAPPGGYINLISIFPYTATAGPLVFYDCTSEALATTANQVLSIEASQITAGTPISLVSPGNPNGQKFVNGITVSCPAGLSYAPAYYINYP